MSRDQNGKHLSVEVTVVLKLAAGTSGSVGTSAPLSLLDWYDLGQELILVLERPVPCSDLLTYIEANGGSLEEEEAEVRRFLSMCLHLFHLTVIIWHQDWKHPDWDRLRRPKSSSNWLWTELLLKKGSLYRVHCGKMSGFFPCSSLIYPSVTFNTHFTLKASTQTRCLIIRSVYSRHFCSHTVVAHTGTLQCGSWGWSCLNHSTAKRNLRPPSSSDTS